MAKKATYGNESIKSLRGADRVRKRPAVIFGSDGLEGCEHSIFEIMSNSIDEAREGRGNRIVVTRYLDGSYEVQDFGSGIPVDYNKNEQRENWELLFCEMYAGSKYDNAGGAGSYEFSLGLNGLGLCATQYASEYMDAEIHRDGYCYTLHFEKGENIGGLHKEPYQKRTSHGMILGQNGEKMSKSRGNVVNPDEIVDQYGADTMRLYEMFIGDFEKAAPWNSDSIKGCKRFLERYWNLQTMVTPEETYSNDLETLMHQTIQKVTEDIDQLKCNTAIAALMTLLNKVYDKGSITRGELRTLTVLLNPFAPHVTEEMWEVEQFGGMVHEAQWPAFDPAKTKEDTVEIVLQVLGKVRSRMTISADTPKEEVLAAAKADSKIAALLEGKTIKKEIYVPGKLVNFVAI